MDENLITAAKENCDCIRISNQYIGQILSKIEPSPRTPNVFGFIASYNQFQILKIWICFAKNSKEN
jgi:hypothetical protein